MLSEIVWFHSLQPLLSASIVCRTKAKTCTVVCQLVTCSSLSMEGGLTLNQGFLQVSDNVGEKCSKYWSPANFDATSAYLFNLCKSPWTFHILRMECNFYHVIHTACLPPPPPSLHHLSLISGRILSVSLLHAASFPVLVAKHSVSCGTVKQWQKAAWKWGCSISREEPRHQQWCTHH